MKYYVSYMNRQQISPEFHGKLLELADRPRGRSAQGSWRKWGALAACCALAVGLGMWRLNLPAQRGGNQFAVSADTQEPGGEDAYGFGEPLPDGSGFTVEGSGGEKLMFPMVPWIDYQDVTGLPQAAGSIALPQGAFQRELTWEEIRTIFWGPEGQPEAEHPKLEQGDLPWMLCWEGYTLSGYGIYDGTGRLYWLHLFGEHPDGPSFHLELAPDQLPPACVAGSGLKATTVFDTEVTGWSQSYDRNGDGVADAICGSQFMAGETGVRFENTGAPFRVDPGDGWDSLAAACQFNALFVRQALAGDGGIYLEHVMQAGEIPQWREEEFSTLDQARAEEEFAPYLPQGDIPGYGEFYGRLSYQEGESNTLFVRWSRGYDNVEVCVCRPEGESWWGETVDVNEPASYDTRLYTIPWCDSVPEEYRESVYRPVFRAEDMSLEIVKARQTEHDTGGSSYCFGVLHPDGTLVKYTCDGLSAGQVWALVRDTLGG